jgi:hypothetical protein
MPFDDFDPGCYNIEWVFEEITYRKRVCFEVGEPFQFLWPFQSHGVFTFQIYDVNGDPVTFDIDGVGYDCFNAIGIPTYEIDEEELNELLALCDDPFGLITFEFIGRGDLEILEWELDPPPGDDDWEIEVEFIGRGDLDLDTIEVADPPDHEMEVEFIGRGDLDLEAYSLGDPPGFAYVLDGEDLVMFAYSFRRLSPTYSGPCCRVIRHADNAELDIDFNGGWRDDIQLANFLMNTDGSIIKWYNQQGPGDDWEPVTGPLDGPLIGNSSGPIKYINGPLTIPSAAMNTGKNLSAAPGTWNGAAHCGHIVAVVSSPGVPIVIDNPLIGTQYYAAMGNVASPHYNDVGTPTTYVDGGLMLGGNQNTLRTLAYGKMSHIWLDSLDMSAVTSCGTGSTGTWGAYINEFIQFNENNTGDRVAKTLLTLPVYGI